MSSRTSIAYEAGEIYRKTVRELFNMSKLLCAIFSKIIMR